MTAVRLQSALDATVALHNTCKALPSLDSSVLCTDIGTVTLILRRLQRVPGHLLDAMHEHALSILEALRNQADRIKDDMQGADQPEASVSNGLKSEVASLFLNATFVLIAVVTTAMFVFLIRTSSAKLLTLSVSDHNNVAFSPNGHQEWIHFVDAAQEAAQDKIDRLDRTLHLMDLKNLLMGKTEHQTGALSVGILGSSDTQRVSRPLAHLSDLLQIENLERGAGAFVTSGTDSNDTQRDSRRLALESLQTAMQEVRRHGVYRPDIIDEAVGQLNLAKSCLDAAVREPGASSTADLKMWVDSFSLLERLHDQLEKEHNWFTNIEMAEYTTLALLSPYTLATFQHIRSGHNAYQYVHGYHLQPTIPADAGKVTTLPIAESETWMQRLAHDLPDFVSRFPRNHYRLERQRNNVFGNLQLAEREVVLILSCKEPIIVDNVSGKEGSVFIAGKVTRQVLESIADGLGIYFDASQADGVFMTAAL